MELNFDKEIDAILRKARDGEAEFNSPSHLDADEISAFAENALPEQRKTLYTVHLADCAKCRKILSNLITLNSESEITHAAAEEKSFAAPAIPWYRKLFVFPNLAYSLGALTLVFGSLIVFVALQSGNNFQNSEISQVSNKPFETKNAPASASTNSSMNMANTAANTNQPTNSVYESNDTIPHGAMNSNMNAVALKPIVPSENRLKSADETSGDDLRLAKTEATAPTDAEGNKPTQNEESKRAEPAKDEVAVEKENDKKMKAERKQSMPSALGSTSQKTQQAPKTDSANATGETTSVGGKMFRREGAAWVDTAYESGANYRLPSLTNISRGSNEYKKLDSDLRRIVERLGGVVIILWKSKAYRIQ
jgi:hypothetical protein